MLSNAALLLSLLLAPVSAPLQAAQTQDVGRLVDERVKAVNTLSVHELLDAAVRLATGVKAAAAANDSAGEGDAATTALPAAEAAFIRTLDAKLADAAKLSDKALLFLVCARMNSAELDRATMATRLVTLLGSKDGEVARGAAQLLQNKTFRELKDKEQDTVVEALTKAATDGDRAPELRLEAAVALHVQGGVDGQRAARKEMIDFLQSSDTRLRTQAALTLARVGDIETPRKELERLALLPGEQGELADAYLKQEQIRRLYDGRVRKLLAEKDGDIASPTLGAGLKGKDDLLRIERMITLIGRSSLEGDQHKREDLIDAALDGMLRSLDEHSSYLTSKSYARMEQELLAAEYGGIGAYVGEDPDDHLFTITRPIYSGPAYKAGLHSDDKIVRIDDWPTFGPEGSRPTEEIIKKLKGKPGTSVKIYVWRRGMDPALIDRPTEEMAVSIEREMIEIPPVQGQLLPGGIALVELSTFSNVASKLLQQKLAEFRAQGMKAVVLDLRSNSGGLLNEAVGVSNLFLPKDTLIVTTESRRDDPEKNYTDRNPFVPMDMPVCVLVNRFSASASEIVSGALQDHQRATVVGQRSFGKGSVQNLLPIPGETDDAFKDENGNRRHDSWEPLVVDHNSNGEFDFGPRARMTIARYLLPSGRSIHREIDPDGKILAEGGVEPDDKVDPRRWETWKLEEMNKLQREKDRKIRAWVDREYPANKKLFSELADCDMDDPQRYPGFDELYNSLGTVLSQQDVRFLVRLQVRRRVQDDRGAAFPDGDYQEDPQLQESIRVLLGKLATPLDSIPQYAATFDALVKDGQKHESSSILAANLSDSARSDLRSALSLIKDGKPLTAHQLEELEKALSNVLDK
jgi:C-terminal peptidase prc